MISRYQRIISIAALIASTSAVQAACITPSGRYSGGGAGPTSMVYQNITANGTGSATISMLLNASTNSFSGSWNGQFKLAGINARDGGIYTNLQDVRSGNVVAANVVNNLPQSRSTINYFDKTTCTGIMTLSGNVFVQQIGPDATKLDNFTFGWPMKILMKFSVANNGNVITLSDYTNMTQNMGYEIRLEKQ